MHFCRDLKVLNSDPMPSLKMKTKATAECLKLKEKYGLHICPKSSMISKNPPRVKVSQNIDEIGTFTQDASVHEELYVDRRMNEVNHEELSREENFFQEHQSNVISPGMVPALPPCTADIDAIFSFLLKSVDVYSNGGADALYVPMLDSEDSDDSCKNSPESSDIYISDFFSGTAIESNPVSNYVENFISLSDYDCQEPSLLCDLTEESMILPFLENAMDTECVHDGRPSEEIVTDAGITTLCMDIHVLRSFNHECHLNTYPDPDYECFDPQLYIRNVPDRQEMTCNFSPSEKRDTKSITLVLDLDETLVHSSLDYSDDADFTIPVFFDMKEHTVYVRKRPHLQFFLEKVAQMFEIVVFTASQSIYAKQLLDILDPNGKLISRRAYRESCIFLEGIYTKDLTVLGVELAKIAIIDNYPQVFRLQVNNGIPIKSWFDDRSDNALISLIPFLETLTYANDVRPIIAKKFGNKE